MTKLVAIDWGTTSFRAYSFDQDGKIIDTISAAAGIMQGNNLNFDDVYYEQLGDLLEKFPEVPVIASGMITSTQGWVETPYLPCPASLTDLSENLTEHTTTRGDIIYFVSGVCQKSPVANIMRGEETQMAGMNSVEALVAILPGTHSKWIRMENDTIKQFSTFMTGELFATITQNTIIGRLITKDDDPGAFIRGVREGFSSEEIAGGIMSKLFGARALPLMGMMNQDSIKDYLSGLLLGTEIQEAVKSGFRIDSKPILCGAPDLVERYKIALCECGIEAETGNSDLAALGLYRIAIAANLI